MALIMLTNDDGIGATGLDALYDEVASIGDVFVVAPDRERSASGHSLTIHKPLKVKKLRKKIYTVNGTPTDCVVIGISKVLPERPIILISGINNGPNLGDDITYSGTVSAALEGTILNIPSMAVSLNMKNGEKGHFDTAAKVAVKVANFIIEKSLPHDTLLNVNVPNVPMEEIKGFKFTRQGRRMYDGAINDTKSPWGDTYYWIGGGTPYWEHGEDTDIDAVQKNFVSITPIHLDLTNYQAIDFIEEQWKPWSSENSES